MKTAPEIRYLLQFMLRLLRTTVSSCFSECSAFFCDLFLKILTGNQWAWVGNFLTIEKLVFSWLTMNVNKELSPALSFKIQSTKTPVTESSMKTVSTEAETRQTSGSVIPPLV